MATPPWPKRVGFRLETLNNGSMLLVGGISYPESEASHIAADAWVSHDGGHHWLRASATAPNVTDASSAVLVSGAVVVAGGMVESSFSRAVWRSDGPDVGSTWVRVTASAAWSARRRAAMVCRSNGTLVLAGGSHLSTRYNDVWASDDGGATWNVVTPSAEWGPRQFHALVETPAGVLLVIGGLGDEMFTDVWASHDGGTSWSQRPTTPWTAPFINCAIVSGSSVYTVAGSPSGLTSVVYRSSDDGVTWSTVEKSTPWGPLGSMGVARGLDGRLVVIAAADTVAPTNAVFTSAVASADIVWATAAASTSVRALCSVPVGTVPVMVELPAAMGDVGTAHVASMPSPAVLYSPPVLSLAPASNTHLATPAGDTLRFAIEFSSPIIAMDAAAFNIDAGLARVVSQPTVSGFGTEWSLDIVVQPGNIVASSCPAGFVLSPDGTVCGQLLDVAADWARQQALCEPFHLARVSSRVDMDFFASLMPSRTAGYWYVHRVRSSPHVHCSDCARGRVVLLQVGTTRIVGCEWVSVVRRRSAVRICSLVHQQHRCCRRRNVRLCAPHGRCVWKAVFRELYLRASHDSY